MKKFSGTQLCPNISDSTDSLARKMESDNKIIKDQQVNGSILVQKSPSESSVSEEVGSAGKSSMPNKESLSKGGLKDIAKLLLKDTNLDLFHLGKSLAPVQDSSKLHEINRKYKEYQRHQRNRTSVEIRKTAASRAAIVNSTIQPNFQKVFDNHLPKPFPMIKDSSANISKDNLQNKYPINYANHLPKPFPTKPYEREKIRKDSLQTSKENNVRLRDPRLDPFYNARLRDPRFDPFNILKRKHQPKEISLICLKYSQENDSTPKKLGDVCLKTSKVRPNNTSRNTEKCPSKMKNAGNEDRSTPGLSTKSSMQVSSGLPATLISSNSTACATLDPNQMSSSLLSFKRGVGDPSDLSIKFTYSHPTLPKTRNEVILQTKRSCSPLSTDFSSKSVQASSPVKTSVCLSSGTPVIHTDGLLTSTMDTSVEKCVHALPENQAKRTHNSLTFIDELVPKKKAKYSSQHGSLSLNEFDISMSSVKTDTTSALSVEILDHNNPSPTKIIFEILPQQVPEAETPSIMCNSNNEIPSSTIELPAKDLLKNQSPCDISNKALSTPAATLTSKVHSNQSSDTRMIKMTDTVSHAHKMSGLEEPTSSLTCSKQLNCEPHNKNACSEVISNKQAMLKYLCSNVSEVPNQEVQRTVANEENSLPKLEQQRHSDSSSLLKTYKQMVKKRKVKLHMDYFKNYIESARCQTKSSCVSLHNTTSNSHLPYDFKVEPFMQDFLYNPPARRHKKFKLSTIWFKTLRAPLKFTSRLNYEKFKLSAIWFKFLCAPLKFTSRLNYECYFNFIFTDDFGKSSSIDEIHHNLVHLLRHTSRELNDMIMCFELRVIKLIKERKRKKMSNTRKCLRRVTSSTDPISVTTSCPDASKELHTTSQQNAADNELCKLNKVVNDREVADNVDFSISRECEDLDWEKKSLETGRRTKKLPETSLQKYTVTEYCEPLEMVNEREMSEDKDSTISREWEEETSETGRSTKKLPETVLQNYTVTKYCEPNEVVNEREMDDYDDYSISREWAENDAYIQLGRFSFYINPTHPFSKSFLEVLHNGSNNYSIYNLINTSINVSYLECKERANILSFKYHHMILSGVYPDVIDLTSSEPEFDLEFTKSEFNLVIKEEPAEENNDKEHFTTDSNKSEHSLSQSSCIIDKEIGTSVPKIGEGNKENNAIYPLQKQPGEDSTTPILKSMHSPASKIKQCIDRKFINLSCTAVQPNTSQEMLFNGFSTTSTFDDPHNLVSSAKKDISTGFSTSLKTTNIRTAQVEVSSNGSMKQMVQWYQKFHKEQLSRRFSCASNSTHIQVSSSKVFFKGSVKVSQAEDQLSSDFPSSLNATNVQAAHSEVSSSGFLQRFYSEDQLSSFSSVNTKNIQIPASEEPSQSSYITSLKSTCKELPASVVPASFSSSVSNPIGVQPVIKGKSVIKKKRRPANRGSKNKKTTLMSCDSVNELHISNNSQLLKNDVVDSSVKSGDAHKDVTKLKDVDLVKESQSVSSSVSNTTGVPPVIQEKSAIKRKRRLTKELIQNKKTTLLSCDSLNALPSSNNAPLLKNDVVDSSIHCGNTRKNVTNLKDVDLVNYKSMQPPAIKEQPAIKRKRSQGNRLSQNKKNTLMLSDSKHASPCSSNSAQLKSNVVDSSIKKGNTYKKMKIKDFVLVKESQSVGSSILNPASVPAIKEQSSIKRKRRRRKGLSQNQRTMLMLPGSEITLLISDNSAQLKNNVVDSSIKSGNAYKNMKKLEDVDLAKNMKKMAVDSDDSLRNSKEEHNILQPYVTMDSSMKFLDSLESKISENTQSCEDLSSSFTCNSLQSSSDCDSFKSNVFPSSTPRPTERVLADSKETVNNYSHNCDSSFSPPKFHKSLNSPFHGSSVPVFPQNNHYTEHSSTFTSESESSKEVCPQSKKEDDILQPYKTDSTAMDSSMNFNDFYMLNFSESTESCEALSSSSTCDSLQSSSGWDSFKSKVFPPCTPQPTERILADSKETVNNHQGNCDSSPNFKNLLHSPFHGCPVPVFPQNNFKTKPSSTITSESEPSKEVCPKSIESRESNCSSQVTGNLSHASSKDNFGVNVSQKKDTQSCGALSSSSTCESLQSSSDWYSFISNVFPPSTPQPIEGVLADSKETVNNNPHNCDSSFPPTTFHKSPPGFSQNNFKTKPSSTITSVSESSKEVCPKSNERRDSSTNRSSQVTGNLSHASSKDNFGVNVSQKKVEYFGNTSKTSETFLSPSCEGILVPVTAQKNTESLLCSSYISDISSAEASKTQKIIPPYHPFKVNTVTSKETVTPNTASEITIMKECSSKELLSENQKKFKCGKACKFASTKIFQTDCYLKDKKVNLSQDIFKSTFQDFDLFGEGKELESYWQHLKRTGNHYINVDCVPDKEVELGGQELESYYFLNRQVKHHRDLKRFLINSAQEPGTDCDTEKHQRIAHQQQMIDGYELAVQALLL